jgi:coenzyme PQQ synthesis protein D (PqqD)
MGLQWCVEVWQSLRDVNRLSSSSTITRSASVIDAEIDREVVALSIERGICYGLNRVGSRIWNLVANPVRVAELCATLVSEYKVDLDVCERETLDLLEELRAEGLITIIDQK